MTNPIKKSHVTLLLKAAFAIGLLYFLSQKGLLSMKDTQRALMQWDKTIPAVLAMVITTFLGVIRWHWLLKAQNIHLAWQRTMQLTFIGTFFNIALPGAISGDFVKAFYIGREFSGQRARSFGAIIFDRVAGLSALALVSAGAMIFGLMGQGTFASSPLVKAMAFFVVLAASVVLAFYGYLFVVPSHRDPLLQGFLWLEKRSPKIGASLTRIYESLRHYHHHRFTVLKVVAISVLIHLMIGWACLNFASALGDTNAFLLATYVIVPLGLLVTAIPVLPAGVGTGNAAFAFLYGLIGSQKGADIFTLVALVNIAIGAVGGLVYLQFRTHDPKPELAQA